MDGLGDVMVKRSTYVQFIKDAYEKGQADCKAGKNEPPALRAGRKTRKHKKHSKKSRKHRK